MASSSTRSEDGEQEVDEELLAGIQEVPRALSSPCLPQNLLDVASRGFIRHRKSSELRNVTTIPQLSLKMLRSIPTNEQ